MIHPTAIIHPDAKLSPTVEVGPYAMIGAGVSIHDETKIGAYSVIHGPKVVIEEQNEIGSHVVIESHATIGVRNKFSAFSSISAVPQDLKFKGEESRIEIGNDNVFREYVTVNRGTEQGGGLTSIGNHNFIMAYVHVAHDCRIGNYVVIANSVGMAGHVEIGDHAIIGGITGIAQFCRIGSFAYIGGCERVPKDIPPYMLASGGGYPIALKGVNAVGLKRKGVSSDVIRALKDVYQLLFFKNDTLQESLLKIRNLPHLIDIPEVQHLVDFIASAKKGIVGRGQEEYDEENKSSSHRRGLLRELSL